MWTRAGTPIYSPHIAGADAPAVKRLRDSGAIILGKTETTPFANNDPTVTRNPWNPDHTPGGSSSGSGAAVADRMCLAAIGTQTGGSLLRPAAYNGVVGFKPTYGMISLEGVIPNSWSLDHVGPLTRCVEDARILWSRMREKNLRPFARRPAAMRSTSKAQKQFPPLRLGHIRDFFDSEVSPDISEHLLSVRTKLLKAGAMVVDLKLPDAFAHLQDAWATIKEPELAAYHRQLFESHQKEYPPNIKSRVEMGLTIAAHKYVEALQCRTAFQQDMKKCLSEVDAAFMPTAPSTAPRGLASTGSSIFNQPWSVVGFPAMSIPSGIDGKGLPLGIQLVAPPMADDVLLAVASWCEQVLAFNALPKRDSFA
jgi:Asp-tRNA(Asn)/Glu-tRNA(Gln) amidotransferase A subunit family amidase